MTSRRTWVVRYVAATLAAVGTTFVLLSACGVGGNKYTEPFNDAPRGRTYSNPVDIITMPDGFNNLATTCGPGQMRYTSIYHKDGPYGATSVVHDPSCPK